MSFANTIFHPFVVQITQSISLHSQIFLKFWTLRILYSFILEICFVRDVIVWRLFVWRLHYSKENLETDRYLSLKMTYCRSRLLLILWYLLWHRTSFMMIRSSFSESSALKRYFFLSQLKSIVKFRLPVLLSSSRDKKHVQSRGRWHVLVYGLMSMIISIRYRHLFFKFDNRTDVYLSLKAYPECMMWYDMSKSDYKYSKRKTQGKQVVDIS